MISAAPTLWFNPPEMATNQASPAGAQFISMFNDPAAWPVTANAAVGMSLTEAFVLQASDQQLSQVLDYLKQHGMKLALVAGMVPVQPNGLGSALEGFTTQAPLAEAVQRIASLGGTLDDIAMDEPLAAGHEDSTGPQLSIAALAQQVATNVAVVKSIFPTVQFMDSENVNTRADIAAWAQAFQAATGTPIAHIGADVDWTNPDIISDLESFAAIVRSIGAGFGITGNANPNETTDQSWALAAEKHIALAMADPLIRPDSIGVETFDPNPTATLPEGLSGTLAHVALEAAEITPLYANGTLAGAKGLAVSTVAPAPSYAGSAVDAVAGAPVSVPGVSLDVSGTAPAGTQFAVVVTDVSGTLGATASGAAHVSSAAPNVLLLTGDLADMNAQLASLTYQGAATGTDTIDITTYDGAGLVDDHQLPVSVAAALPVTLPAGLTASAGWLAQAQSSLAALCEQIQGVSPSAQTLSTLVAALAGGETLAQIRGALAGAQLVQAELKAVYFSHNGTVPSAAQLGALTRSLISTGSLQAVEAPLLAHSAAETQIAALYQQVEGTSPGAADLATLARSLLLGTPLAAIRAQLAASATVQASLAAMFQHLYDVPPTGAQLAALTAELAGTTSFAQLRAQFVSTARAMVTADYQSVLDRAPSASELNGYVTDLMAGSLENSSIYAQLAHSTQSTANVAALYQAVAGQAAPQSMITTLEQCLSIGQIPLAQLQTDLATAATLYRQITGQPLTASALSPLMYDFLNKAPVSKISFWIATSGQEDQLLETRYKALFGSPITAAQLGGIETALQNGTTTMAAVQAALAAQAGADVPVLANLVASQTDYADTWIAPFGAATLTDPDPTAVETMTVTLTGGDGHLSGVSGLNASATAFTRTGSAAMLQGDLRTIDLIDPTPHGAGTADLTVTVRNGAGNTASATVTIATITERLPASTTLLFMPAGNDAVGAKGGETFVFPAGGFGMDEITGFNPATDMIQLPKALVPNYSALMADETLSAGALTITLGASESIHLPGLSPANLAAANFVFA
jgi:hypothetical protein